MTAPFDYWHECVSEALDEAGVVATSEQIATIAKAVESAHDCHGMAFPLPENPYPREIADLNRKLAVERSKIGCPNCRGRGRIEERAGPWWSSSPCDHCHGEGKIVP